MFGTLSRKLLFLIHTQLATGVWWFLSAHIKNHSNLKTKTRYVNLISEDQQSWPPLKADLFYITLAFKPFLRCLFTEFANLIQFGRKIFFLQKDTQTDKQHRSNSSLDSLSDFFLMLGLRKFWLTLRNSLFH